MTSINPTVARIIGTEFDLVFLINENTKQEKFRHECSRTEFKDATDFPHFSE